MPASFAHIEQLTVGGGCVGWSDCDPHRSVKAGGRADAIGGSGAARPRDSRHRAGRDRHRTYAMTRRVCHVQRRPALRQREAHRLIERGHSARAVGAPCAARAGERRHRTVREAHAAQLVPLVLSHVEERAVGAQREAGWASEAGRRRRTVGGAKSAAAGESAHGAAGDHDAAQSVACVVGAVEHGSVGREGEGVGLVEAGHAGRAVCAASAAGASQEADDARANIDHFDLMVGKVAHVQQRSIR